MKEKKYLEAVPRDVNFNGYIYPDLPYRKNPLVSDISGTLLYMWFMFWVGREGALVMGYLQFLMM